MTLARLICLAALAASHVVAGQTWTFHCEAEKGDQSATIARLAQPLEAYTQKLPTFSSDPLDSDARLLKATERIVATFKHHRIYEVKLEVKEAYYTDLFILICETDEDRFLPIYMQQYNRGTRTPRLQSVTCTATIGTLCVAVDYSGTGPTTTNDTIEISEIAPSTLQLKCDRREP